MADFILHYYDWFKVLHVLAIISWMAGLFYQPRLYVYHAERAAKGSELSETLKIMEQKLMHIIINPAMILSWITGVALILANPSMLFNSKWLPVKLAMLVLMQIFHAFLSIWRKDFLRDENKHSGVFYRVSNEVPTVLMIVIVIMVIIKPF